jgi:transglutaminase-like putative cysteine protease
MLIRFGYDITITCAEPTPLICLMSPRVDQLAAMTVPEVFITTPMISSTLYFDLFGNTCRRINAPAGDFRMASTAVIHDSGALDMVDPSAPEAAIPNLPDETLVYLLGSRYCETDRLSQQAWDMFGKIPPGWGRVQAISDLVHGHIKFDYLKARATRTAEQAWDEREGVCRDYAHLMIAFCRCMNIPARYVNGYLGDIGVPLLGEMDFSAWVEVFLGGRWVTFDPRNNKRRVGRIKVAHGRDAADVPLIHSFGPHILKVFRVWCYDEADAPAKQAEHAGMVSQAA